MFLGDESFGRCCLAKLPFLLSTEEMASILEAGVVGRLFVGHLTEQQEKQKVAPGRGHCSTRGASSFPDSTGLRITGRRRRIQVSLVAATAVARSAPRSFSTAQQIVCCEAQETLTRTSGGI